MSTPLDPQLVFDRFVVGTGNRLAAAAARRVAESPGSSYNPLVISGAPGLGKTHLLHAIGALARALEPERYVHFEAIDDFVDRLTTSISAGTLDEFREATERMSLVLLDDLQSVAGKVRTQEELLRTWEILLQRGSQVVVTADRPPQEIPALDARLASRLAGGLIVDIGPPGPETRLGILRQLLRERALPIDDEVLSALARLPIENARELQGAFHRIAAAIEIEARPVAASEVAALLGLGDADARVASPDDEFGDFLSDVASSVAAVVETSPWRRRIALAILRWEGEGIRTRRLEAALDADSAPDVDALLSAFSRDVARLREIGRTLRARPEDPALLTDPDRLGEAEALLRQERDSSAPAAPDRGGRAGPAERPARAAAAPASPDPFFGDAEKFAWNWPALDDRIPEEVG